MAKHITLAHLSTALQSIKQYITKCIPTKTSDLSNDSGYVTKNTTYQFENGKTDGTFSVTPSDGNTQNITINGFEKTFGNVTYANNTLTFRHASSGTVLQTITLPKEQFLDTTQTKFVNKFTWSSSTYSGSTDPNLNNKPVLVLALKDETNKITYSFINMTDLVDIYTGGTTATASVTVSGDHKITANVTSVSTDLLSQGTDTLIFNCGNASF